MKDHSRMSLLVFLDYLADKGLQNKNTVASSRAATNSMLSILDEDEAADLRQIDLDMVATRFANLKGSKYPPATLQVYRARTAKAIGDFLRYKDNPANFKVTSGPAKPKGNSADAERKSKPSTHAPVSNSAPPSEETKDRIMTLNVPVAIRAGCIMQLNGIPADLSLSEATRISNIVLAMAIAEKE